MGVPRGRHVWQGCAEVRRISAPARQTQDNPWRDDLVHLPRAVVCDGSSFERSAFGQRGLPQIVHACLMSGAGRPRACKGVVGGAHEAGARLAPAGIKWARLGNRQES